MRRLIAFLFLLLASVPAHAQCSFSNPTACGSPGMNNAAVGGNLSVGGQLSAIGGGSLNFQSPLMINGINGGIGLSAGGDAIIGSATSTPQLTIGNSSGNTSSFLELQSAASTQRSIEYVAGSAILWTEGNNNTTQSGSNVGADFVISRYSDAGSLLGTPLTITRSTGMATWASGQTLTHLTTGPTLSLTGNNATLSNTNPIAWLNESGFVSGTLSGSTTGNVWGVTVNDKIASTSSSAPQIFSWIENIAPNSNTASGNRILANFFQNVVGSSTGGTYTNPGIDQAINAAIWVQSNEGGTSSLYQGAHTTYGEYCELKNGATFVGGCASFENDLTAETGSSYLRNTQGLFVHLAGNAVLGLLGPDLGLQWSEQTGASVIGYKCILCLGTQGQAGFPSNPAGAVIYADALLGGTPQLGNIIDATQVTLSGCYNREPFVLECSVQANGITGATRLTTDGQSANGYVSNAIVTARGSGYTSQPSVTVTGCTGATIGASVGAGSTVGFLGVSAPGTGCAAESTMSISGGGGSSGAGKLTIVGNTLNFPINSTINVACTIAATSFPHSGSDAIGWHIQFGATMGATASTAAIVGSPSWTQDYATASAASHIGISTPAADTSLGAINLTITPTSGTWDVGGSCKVTKSAQT